MRVGSQSVQSESASQSEHTHSCNTTRTSTCHHVSSVARKCKWHHTPSRRSRSGWDKGYSTLQDKVRLKRGGGGGLLLRPVYESRACARCCLLFVSHVCALFVCVVCVCVLVCVGCIDTLCAYGVDPTDAQQLAGSVRTPHTTATRNTHTQHTEHKQADTHGRTQQ